MQIYSYFKRNLFRGYLTSGFDDGSQIYIAY